MTENILLTQKNILLCLDVNPEIEHLKAYFCGSSFDIEFCTRH